MYRSTTLYQSSNAHIIGPSRRGLKAPITLDEEDQSGRFGPPGLPNHERRAIMGRFDTLMYDNRNWKGSVALVASILIGLSVAFKGFDELPDLQNDRRAATVALYKAKRVFDKQVIATPAYAKAEEMVKMADDRLGATDLGIYLANATFGVGLAIMGISVVLYLRRSQGLNIQTIQAETEQLQSPAPRLAA
jgi:hypothetical protein